METGKEQGFKGLLVWQKSLQLSVKIYSVTKKFPREEIYAITSQMQRAATSVPANIAEGYERQHNKEYIQFLYIAKGSLGELETFLLIAKELKYLDDEQYNKIDITRKEVAKLLFGLIKSLQ